MTPPAQLQPKEPSPPPPRPRNIFDELLDGYEDVFARLIAKGYRIIFQIFYFKIIFR